MTTYMVWCVGRSGQVVATDLVSGRSLMERHLHDCGYTHRVFKEVPRVSLSMRAEVGPK